MAEEHKNDHVMDLMNTMFEGMDGFITSKTVVGEPIHADNATLIPLMEVSCGMGIGGFTKDNTNRGRSAAGGMSTKITPSAILVVQNGNVKLVNVKNQDAMTKIMDMIPDMIDKFTGGSRVGLKAEKTAEAIAEKSETQIVTEK